MTDEINAALFMKYFLHAVIQNPLSVPRGNEVSNTSGRGNIIKNNNYYKLTTETRKC